MSFGRAAAQGGFPVVADGDACPCGSGDRFDACCAPILRGAPTPTAERLMRSRYTAFVVGDARHLALSWHPRTRPVSIEPDPGVRWTRLEIVGSVDGAEGDDEGVVEFRAHWLDGRERGTLHERSRFARHRGAWCYVDGDVR